MSAAPEKILVIVNDQPYGSERPYNASLRLAGSLAKREGRGARLPDG